MARNGSGSYSLPNDALVNGETSDVDDYNSTMNDIATALTDSLTANGEKVWSGTQDANGNKIVLDADGDTSITADTDDQIDIEIAGSDSIVLTTNGITQFGGHLKFPATQNASTNVNTLDDYEEGTFTPVMADASSGGNASGTSLSGRYIKIGKLVTVWIRGANLDTTGLTAGNDVYIRALPFTAESGSFTMPGSCILQAITFTGLVAPVIEPNTTWIRFTETTSGTGAVDYLIVSEFSDDAADFFLTLTYETED